MLKTFTDILLLSAVVVYVVDLSGFTDSWRSALARWLHVRDLRPLKPFDCSLCLSFWVGLAYSLATGSFSLPVLAFVCLCSFLTMPMAAALGKLHRLLTKLLS